MKCIDFGGTTSHEVISQMTSCLSHADTNINARVNNKRFFYNNLQFEIAKIDNASHVNQTVQLQESKLLQSNSRIACCSHGLNQRLGESLVLQHSWVLIAPPVNTYKTVYQ